MCIACNDPTYCPHGVLIQNDGVDRECDDCGGEPRHDQ